MRGFGNLDKMDDLKSETKTIEEKDLIKNKYTDEQENKLNNVVIPNLDDDSYVPVEKKKGAAGNSEPNKKIKAIMGSEDKDDENQDAEDSIMDGMGGMSIGGSIKKEMSRTEGLNPTDTVDEEPMKLAKDRWNENIIDKVKDVFNDVFDNNFGKAKDKEYDLDSTKQRVELSMKPLDRVPKGW